jgi:transposase InsO family protein
MCEILKLNRSSYYKWLNRGETEKDREDQVLCQILLGLHEQHNGILGYRRMTLWVNRLNQTDYNKKRIRRLMRLLGISSRIRRQRKGYKKSTPQVIAENILNREFTAEKPNKVWLTDVTEFKVIGSTTKLYLSAIFDLCDHRIVAYKMGTSNNNHLVFKTFDEAVAANPGAKPLFHSDRGFQYTNKVFKKKLDEIEATQSMSRVGRCIDNGPMEGFWGIIKVEMYYLNDFHSHKELREAIHKYISFYNNERYQEKLKGLTPIEYRNQVLVS